MCAFHSVFTLLQSPTAPDETVPNPQTRRTLVALERLAQRLHALIAQVVALDVQLLRRKKQGCT